MTGGPSICEESLKRRLDPLREAIDDERDKDGRSDLRHGEAPPIGDGRGVISPIAFNWGEDIIEAGDKEPALDKGAMSARRLGVRRG
jgi:hypothetical protein